MEIVFPFWKSSPGRLSVETKLKAVIGYPSNEMLRNFELNAVQWVMTRYIETKFGNVAI